MGMMYHSALVEGREPTFRSQSVLSFYLVGSRDGIRCSGTLNCFSELIQLAGPW